MKYLLIIVLLFFACNTKTRVEPDIITVEKIAKEKYGDTGSYLYNKDKSYVICFNRNATTALNPYPTLRYFVFDQATRTILNEDTIAKGSIKWIEKYKFEVSWVPGIVAVDPKKNKNSYIYDVKLKKRTN